MAKLNKDLDGTLITDEMHANIGTGLLLLDHDTFYGGAQFAVRTAANGEGIPLSTPADFTLENQHPGLSAEAGQPVYTALLITNPTYQTGQLFFTYSTLGDFAEAADINDIWDKLNTITATPQANMLGVWPHLALKIKRAPIANMATGENYVGSMTTDGTYLYVGLRTNPAKIIKFDPRTRPNMTKVAVLTLDNSLFENDCRSLIYVGNDTLVAGLYTAPAKFIKIDTKSMTKTGSYSLPGPDSYCSAMTIIPAGYPSSFDIIACLDDFPGKMVMLDFDTFSQLGTTLTFATGENYPRSIAYDGNYIYAACDVAPGKIVKINPMGLTKVATLTMATGAENNPQALCFDGRFLYVGLSMSPSKIAKVNLGTFTTVGTALALSTGENACNSLTLDGIGGLYAGCYTSPAKVVKIDLTSFTRLSAFTLFGGENSCYALTTDGTYIFIGLNTAPGKVVPRDISSYWG